jgi:hypothetical protein
MRKRQQETTKKNGKFVDFKSSEMLHRVVGRMISGESKDSNISLQVPAVLAQPYPRRWSQNPSKRRKPITQ